MKKNIAIFGLDDDLDMLEIISAYFDTNKVVNYFGFHNKDMFIEKFNETVHIAIIDHYLGGTSIGFDIMQRIFEINKQNNALIECKIIVISGQQDPKMIAYYLNHRAFRYLDKNDEEFLLILGEYVKDAIDEVESFYKSINKWKLGIDTINGIIEETKSKIDERNYNKANI